VQAQARIAEWEQRSAQSGRSWAKLLEDNRELNARNETLGRRLAYQEAEFRRVVAERDARLHSLVKKVADSINHDVPDRGKAVEILLGHLQAVSAALKEETALKLSLMQRENDAVVKRLRDLQAQVARSRDADRVAALEDALTEVKQQGGVQRNIALAEANQALHLELARMRSRVAALEATLEDERSGRDTVDLRDACAYLSRIVKEKAELIAKYESALRARKITGLSERLLTQTMIQ
jgi:hypothetical protein